MLDAAKIKIDFKDFELIPEPRRRTTYSMIQVNPSGRVTLNKYFWEEIRAHTDSRRLEFSAHRTDKRILMLRVTEAPNYTFNSDGGRYDPEFTRSLVENGVVLPARYEVKWNNEASAWVGVLCGDLTKSAREKTLKAARRKKNV